MTTTTETPCPVCADTGEVATAPRYKTSTPCPTCGPKEAHTMNNDELYAVLTEASQDSGWSYSMRLDLDLISAHPGIEKILDGISILSDALSQGASGVPVEQISSRSFPDLSNFKDWLTNKLFDTGRLARIAKDVVTVRAALAHENTTKELSNNLVGKYIPLRHDSVKLHYGWSRVSVREWGVIKSIELRNPAQCRPAIAGEMTGPLWAVTVLAVNKMGTRSKDEKTFIVDLYKATGLFDIVMDKLPEMKEKAPRKLTRRELEQKIALLESGIKVSDAAQQD